MRLIAAFVGKNTFFRAWLNKKEIAQYTPVFLDHEGNRIIIGVDTYLKGSEEEARQVAREALFLRLFGNLRYTEEVIRVSKSLRGIPGRLKLFDVPLYVISGPLYDRMVQGQTKKRRLRL